MPSPLSTFIAELRRRRVLTHPGHCVTPPLFKERGLGGEFGLCGRFAR